MNRKSVALTLAGPLTLFSAGLLFAANRIAADTFGKLAPHSLAAGSPRLTQQILECPGARLGNRSVRHPGLDQGRFDRAAINLP
jgi:hypothetical protein